MKIHKLQSQLLILIFLFATSLQAQVETKTTFNSDRSQITIQTGIDNLMMMKEDIDRESQGAAPLRVAKIFPLEADMNTAGVWSQTSDQERSWILTINVPNAHGIIVNYSDFYLPEGSSLYVYSDTKDFGATVYTHENKQRGNRYMTETSWGSQITLEYVAPDEVKDEPRLHITSIGYKYNEIYDELPTVGNTVRSLNDYNNRCIPNINCPEGKDWQKQKKGVVRLSTNKGGFTYSCTGSLINNTRMDKIPYVLTAAHCLSVDGVEIDPIDTDFIFDDEHPECENLSVRPAPKLLSGADILTASPINGGSDGTLLRLYSNIPKEWEVYFNGWDLSNIGSENTSGSVIQHPHGDVKKIALFSQALVTDTWIEYEKSGALKNRGTDNAHWRVNYTKGVTQGGSSGSPLFNQYGLIVGTLTGGATSCTLLKERDYYGKMYYHWNQYLDEKEHMNQYLDPDQSGVIQLVGMNQDGETPPPPPEKPDPKPEKATLKLSMNGDNLMFESNKEMVKVRIVSQVGHDMYSMMNAHWEDGISTTRWSSGLYIVSVWFKGGEKIVQKIIK